MKYIHDQTINGESGSLLFWLDFSFTIVAFMISFLARDFFIQKSQPLHFYSHLFILPLLLVLVTSLLSYFGGYKNPTQISIPGYSGAIIKALVVSIGAIMGLLFFLKIEYVSRFVIITFMFLEFFTLLVLRFIYSNNFKNQIRNGTKKINILVIGSRHRAGELVEVFQERVIVGVSVMSSPSHTILD